MIQWHIMLDKQAMLYLIPQNKSRLTCEYVLMSTFRVRSQRQISVTYKDSKVRITEYSCQNPHLTHKSGTVLENSACPSITLRFISESGVFHMLT